ncbi:MAG: hypothetical protein OEZ06_03505 [Myxococcales bacterium]|nr:hypothetical protein [Myxococcales bacterium]
MTERAQWVFDALPPSGARRGGNPAEHAFRHDLGTFVREVVQNANDQAIAMPRISFRFRALEAAACREFLDALGWSTLLPHLEAAASARGGRDLRRTLEAIAEREELLMLYVEDFGTEGLSGDESEGESNFRALCKDTLFSHKRDAAAGGSYGLGKSVLWIFSGLSTVLFDSTLMELPADRDNPRFIGRAELPSHRVEGPKSARGGGGDFAGPGWFGHPTRTGLGRRAESIWGPQARNQATGLGLRARSDEEPGTSIAIVGFRDPTADEVPDVDRLVERTREAIAEFFWPAMHLPLRRLRADVGAGEKLSAVEVASTSAAPFLDAWKARTEPQQALEQPGDTVVRKLPISIPAGRDGGAAVRGEVDLIVRLASERHPGPRVGQVALFRGPGMVVKYWDRSRIALGMRPFHAVLACGVARDPQKPTDEDRAVEHFLRLSEPPSHDDWQPTQQLKQTYMAGYRKALDDLKASVDETLRKLMQPAAGQGTKGPERLQKRFPIGKKGPADKRASAFHIRALSAHLEAGGWHFSGAIEPAQPGHPWVAELRTSEVDERGHSSDQLPVIAIDIDGDAQVELQDGVALLRASAVARKLHFSGRTATSPCVGALELELTGRIERPSP